MKHTGNSNSSLISQTTNKTKIKPSGAQNKDSLEFIKVILNERYKALFAAKDKSDSIATRYELSIMIDEVKNIYSLIFGKEN